MTVYNNLKELLDSHGCESPWRFGRNLYKYTDCGPWTVFVTPDGERVYYESKEARERSLPLFTNIECTGICIGVEIGSIVEGSDVEVNPIELNFPFSEDDLDNALKEINDACSFYWDRDNSDWFQLRYGKKGKVYFFHYNWDDIIWDGDKPSKKVKDAVNAFKDAGGNMTWNESWGIQTHKCGEWFPLPGARDWEIMQWENDCDYYC